MWGGDAGAAAATMVRPVPPLPHTCDACAIHRLPLAWPAMAGGVLAASPTVGAVLPHGVQQPHVLLRVEVKKHWGVRRKE